MNKPYLHNLTALRGIAALLVAVLHFHFFLGPVLPYQEAGVIDKFYLMVDLFFILSGFVICYVYEPDFAGGITGKETKGFFRARLARIYPLHLITLGAELGIFLLILALGKFAILPAHWQHLYRLDGLPVQLTFLQTVGIFKFDTFNAPAWSLSAEWWAYVLFPFLFVAFRKLGYKYWFVAFGVALAGWLGIEFFLAAKEPFMSFPPDAGKRSLDVNWHYGTLRGICGFVAGMGVWQLYTQQRGRKLLGNGWAILLLTGLAFASMHFGAYDTVTVSLFAAVILAAAYGSSGTDRVLSWSVLRRLGQWSFSIYMWHMVLIHLVLVYFIAQRTEPVQGLLRPLRGYPTVTLLVVFLLVTCGVGYLSFRFLETPARRWVKGGEEQG